MFRQALLVGYYQFTGNLRTARAALLPYMGELANHTMSTLAHADETATMASDMMADGKLQFTRIALCTMRCAHDCQQLPTTANDCQQLPTAHRRA